MVGSLFGNRDCERLRFSLTCVILAPVASEIRANSHTSLYLCCRIKVNESQAFAAWVGAQPRLIGRIARSKVVSINGLSIWMKSGTPSLCGRKGVGLHVPNCELFGGRSSYKEQVGSPQLSPKSLRPVRVGGSSHDLRLRHTTPDPSLYFHPAHMRRQDTGLS